MRSPGRRGRFSRSRLPGGHDPHGPDVHIRNGGNIARAQFCNRRGAKLMLRIHADGAARLVEPRDLDALPGLPSRLDGRHLRASLRAARLVQRATVSITRARDLGLVRRSDLTGFNWANVPAILVETGFMTNPTERARLQSSSYQWRIARGLTAGVSAFTRP